MSRAAGKTSVKISVFTRAAEPARQGAAGFRRGPARRRYPVKSALQRKIALVVVQVAGVAGTVASQGPVELVAAFT